jgi:hypothetical protein
MSETLDYVVTANTGGSFTGGTYPTPATPGFIWAINQLVLTPSVNIQNFFGGTQNSATITLAFCLNATTCTGPASGSIVATYAGTNTAAYTCSYAGCVSGTSNVVNLSGPVTQIAVAETVQLATFANSLNSVTVNTISNQFGQTALSPVPEPSTLLLIGAGLSCIALCRKAARRKA